MTLVDISEAIWIPWKMIPCSCIYMVELSNVIIDVFCLILFPCRCACSLVLYTFVCGAATDAEISGEKVNTLFLRRVVQNMTEHSSGVSVERCFKKLPVKKPTYF